MRANPLFLILLWLVCVIGEQQERDQANHIFNAIHSSMRQWGSSLNHNGMSFFLATVPQSTLLYHGRPTNETVEGMEWVAFEPEHALIFAYPQPAYRILHNGFYESPRQSVQPDFPSMQPPSPLEARLASMHTASQDHFKRPTAIDLGRDQISLGRDHENAEVKAGDHSPQGGFLHTLRASHDLRLLYIDGMAAGKCDKGTLDSTDFVLLNRTFDDGRFDGPVGGDYARAHTLCALAQKQWHGRIDGFLRMEAGFEIILCSFQESTTTVSKHRVEWSSRRAGSFEAWMQAVSSRYDGIGGHRVLVNHESIITAFAYPIDLFNGSSLPRLKDVQHSARSRIRTDVESLVLRKNIPARDWIDWQAIADMIVARWGEKLIHLHSYNFTNLEDLHAEIEETYRPFIDYDHRWAANEVRQCALQFMPLRYHTSVASAAVGKVAQHICQSLHTARQQRQTVAVKDTLKSLIEYLQWPSWKRCKACAGNEVCFVPIWPFGSIEDYERPSCLVGEEMKKRRGYWDA